MDDGLTLPEHEQLEGFLERLFRQNEFSVKLGLASMRAALDACGQPDRHLDVVLVAGTNGKGEVSSRIAALAQVAGGAPVGLFTSPHLIHFAERLRVQGRPMDARALLALGPAVLAAFGGDDVRDAALAEELLELSRGTPDGVVLTYFELATLMAVLHFAREGCGLAVMEVGLGGRLDATNALTPRLSVISALGLDHQRQLGDSLPEIAREKAGILREGVPAVLASRAAGETLRALAEASGAAPVWCLDRDFSLSPDGPRWRFDAPGYTLELDPHEVPTAAHARDNMAASLAAALLSPPPDASVLSPPSGERLRRGVRAARWPGRLWPLPEAGRAALRQRLGRDELPEVLLDAAHNPLGAQALVKHLLGQYAERPLSLVLGVMGDKDIEGIGAALAPLTLVGLITTPVRSPRAASAETICRRLGRADARPAKTLSEALSLAVSAVSSLSSGCVVIAGSIYLLGELLAELGVSYHSLVTCEDDDSHEDINGARRADV